MGFAYRLEETRLPFEGATGFILGVSFSQFVGDPTIGFSANPFVQTPDNGRTPAFQLDQGFPQSAIVKPPFIDPTISNGGSPIAVAKNGLTLPRYQNWSLTMERQLTNNMKLDVSYIANRGTRLGGPLAAQGIRRSMNNPSVLALAGSRWVLPATA